MHVGALCPEPIERVATTIEKQFKQEAGRTRGGEVLEVFSRSFRKRLFVAVARSVDPDPLREILRPHVAIAISALSTRLSE
jgi:hypothetical protein